MKTRTYDGVVHKKFGPGVLLGKRSISVGDIVDVYFIADQTTKAILATFIQDLFAKQNPLIPDDELQRVREAYTARYRIEQDEDT